MTIIQNKTYLYRALLIYWILIPIAFFVLISGLMFNTGLSFMNLLHKMPSLSLGLLLCCLMLMLAYQLYQLTEDTGMKKFLFIILFQQIFTLNFIGAGLAYLQWRLLEKNEESIPLQYRALLGFILVFSVFTIAILLLSIF